MSDFVRNFWIGLDGNTIQVPDHEHPVDFAMERAGAFGLSDDDTLLWTTRPKDDDLRMAALDRILTIGCGGILGTNKQESANDMPVILIEVNSENRVAIRNNGVYLLPPGHGSCKRNGMVVANFWRESYPVNDRLIRFFREQKTELTGITASMDILMVAWELNRKWVDKPEAFIKGSNISEGRAAVCTRCHQKISWDELIEKNKCSRCGLLLA